MAAVLEMKNITKSFGSVRANEDVTFSVQEGALHALAGENGAGKSTLMKILFGIQKPDAGKVFIRGREVRFNSPLDAIHSGIGMVQQHFALAESLGALDNIILGSEPRGLLTIKRDQASRELKELAGSHLEVNWESPVEELSMGERQRVEILKILYRKASILVLDEPTAVLTPQEVVRFFGLLRELRNRGCTVILITHKLGEIFALCDTVTVLKGGRVVSTEQVKDLDREKLVQLMVGHAVKEPGTSARKSETPIVKLTNLETNHAAGRLQGLNLDVYPGEIVGIAGVEGNGQKALIEALLRLCEFRGEAVFDSKPWPQKTLAVRESGVGLIPEDRHNQGMWLTEDLTLNSIIGLERDKKFSARGLLNIAQCRAWARECIAAYGIKASGSEALAGSLSGGNQQKLIVARELEGRRPRLLIASQPTRGVDIGAIEFIHRKFVALAREGNGVLLISSELEELFSLSTRVLVLFAGKIVGMFHASQGYREDAIGQLMTGGNP